jgi:hypothetical protein
MLALLQPAVVDLAGADQQLRHAGSVSAFLKLSDGPTSPG